MSYPAVALPSASVACFWFLSFLFSFFLFYFFLFFFFFAFSISLYYDAAYYILDGCSTVCRCRAGPVSAVASAQVQSQGAVPVCSKRAQGRVQSGSIDIYVELTIAVLYDWPDHWTVHWARRVDRWMGKMGWGMDGVE